MTDHDVRGRADYVLPGGITLNNISLVGGVFGRAEFSEAELSVHTQLRKLLALPVEEFVTLTGNELIELLGPDLTYLRTIHPKAMHALQVLRLYLQDHIEGQGYEIRKLTGNQGDQLLEGLSGTFGLIDRPVSELLEKDSKGGGILEALKRVEEVCRVSDDDLAAGRPAKGILVANTIETLRNALSVPGAQVLTLEDPVGRVLGAYIYYLAGDGVCGPEDQIYIEYAKSEFEKQGRTVNRLGVVHVVCVDSDIESYVDEHGQTFNRRDIYRDMHAYMVAEARRCGIDIMVGVVRIFPCPNIARAAHEEMGAEVLVDSFREEYPDNDQCERVTRLRGDRTLINSIIFVDVNSPKQDKFVMPNHRPVLRCVRAFDFDAESDGDQGVDRPIVQA